MSLTLIGCLEGCITLKSLNLTLNEYENWTTNNIFRLRKGLGRNISLISLSLTLNIYTVPSFCGAFDFDILDDYVDKISNDDVVPNISMDSFTLTISDFSARDVQVNFDRDYIIGYVSFLISDVVRPNYKSLNTFSLTLNNRNRVNVSSLFEIVEEVMKVNSLRTLRLKLNHSPSTRYGDLSKLVVKSPSLELIELTICHYEGAGWSTRCVAWLETLKWEKQ